ncbi:MAG: hypothetical protein WCF44_01000 [Candidatus Methylophosphatis roskildensis]
MNTSRIGFLALLSIASLAGGGCATLAESESAARELVAKKSAESSSPSALVTRYSGALESFGDMLEKYRPSGKVLYVQTRSIGDSTNLSHPLVGAELPGDITEMVRSAINRVGSRVVYVPFQPDYVLAHAQQGSKIQLVQPDVLITGAITEFDRAIGSAGKGANARLVFGGGRGQTDLSWDRKAGTTLSDLSLDLNLVDFATQTMIPRVQAANTIRVLNQTYENGIDIAIYGNAFGVVTNTRYLQGRHSAIRLLVDLSVLEVLGRHTNVPYWRCIPNGKPDPVVMDAIKRSYAKNDTPTRVKWLQNTLKEFGFPLTASGNLDDKTRLAVDEVAPRFKIQTTGDYLDPDLFAGIYVNIPLKRIPPAGLASSTGLAS